MRVLLHSSIKNSPPTAFLNSSLHRPPTRVFISYSHVFMWSFHRGSVSLVWRMEYIVEAHSAAVLCRVPVFELSAFLAILPSVVSPRSEQDPEGHEGGESWGKLSEECTHFLLFFLCIALLFKVRCRILWTTWKIYWFQTRISRGSRRFLVSNSMSVAPWTPSGRPCKKSNFQLIGITMKLTKSLKVSLIAMC